MSKVLTIIQARLDSIRLPGKVLLQIPPESGVSMLEMAIRKALLAKTVDEVVVVTPDKALTKICKMCGVNYLVKGWPERDVLKEFYWAAKSFGADVVVRLTADCPLLRPEEIDRCVNAFLGGDYDLVYNTDENTGQLSGEGSDCECFSFDALTEAYLETSEDQREHVTTYMRKMMRTRFLDGAPLGIRSINTQEDYEWLCQYMKGAVAQLGERPGTP